MNNSLPVNQNNKPKEEMQPVINEQNVAPVKKTEPNAMVVPNNVAVPLEKGINLIPTLSKEEILHESKKKKLNVGSIVSLLVLVVITILIVGFNIISKMTVNAETASLAKYENTLTNLSQTIISSNEITERVLLYKSIQGQSFSPKLVIEYINNIASKSGNTTLVTKYSFGNDLSFTIEGEAASLEDVSKFWYLLSNDPEVEEVTLSSVGNSANVARFTFDGSLVFEDFLSSTE